MSQKARCDNLTDVAISWIQTKQSLNLETALLVSARDASGIVVAAIEFAEFLIATTLAVVWWPDGITDPGTRPAITKGLAVVTCAVQAGIVCRRTARLCLGVGQPH